MLDLGQFPIRPQRSAGESLAGYLYRFYGSNGHRVPDALHQSLESIYRPPPEPSRFDEAWRLLDAIAGGRLDAEREVWRLNHLAAPPGEGRLSSQAEFSYQNLRACPRCLELDGHHQAAWELPLVQTCLRHRCLLLEKCLCKRKISWRTLQADWRCPCGLDLREIANEPARRGELNTDEFVTRGIQAYRHEAGMRSDRVQPAVTPFRTVQLMHELVWQVPPPEWRAALAKTRAGAITGRLLGRWPALLRRSLTRVERLLVAGNSQLCIELMPDVALRGVHEWYARVVADKSAAPELRQLAEWRRLDLLPPSKNGNMIVFNPTLGLQERQRRLCKFSEWWKRLFGHYEPVAPHIARLLAKRSTSSTHAMHYGSYSRPHWTILNRLLDAAWADLPVEKFRPLAWAWPERFVVVDEDPQQVLFTASAQLAGASTELSHRLERLCRRAYATSTE